MGAVTGVISAAGAGSVFATNPNKPFNIDVSGVFAATLQLERSFDAGVTWSPKSPSAVFAFTAPISMSDFEPEGNVVYRINCTSYSSGTAVYRLSQ